MGTEILLLLLTVGFLILFYVVFPIHVLIRLSRLTDEIERLKRLSGVATDVEKLKREIRARPSTDAGLGAVQPEIAGAPPVAPAWTPIPQRPGPPGQASQTQEPVRLAEVAALPPPPPPPPPAAPATRGPAPDLESLLGADWLSKLGVIALAIAAALFLKYAFDSGWIGPRAQVTIGLFAAGLLLALGQVLLVREKYRAYAQVLSSGGIVIYFLSVYAAFGFYRFLEFAPAFGMLAVGALAASALAVANDTPMVALLCLAGAFLTPVLLQRQGSGESDLFRLYLYLAGLNVWSAALVRVKPWPLVTALSFVGTWLLFFGSGPNRVADCRIPEAFAAVFLVFACYGGVSGVRTEKKEAPVEEAGFLPGAQMRIGLILLGCVLFATASAIVLAGAEAIGLPAVASIGVLVALLLAALAVALQDATEFDRASVSMLRYLSAAVLVLMVALAIPNSPVVPREQAPAAFGFAVFGYLLFLLVAAQMRRQEGGDDPAAVLFGANALTHTVVSFHALSQVAIWGIPAAVLWLPLAGWVAIVAYRLSARPEDGGDSYPQVAMVAAQAMPAIAFFGALNMWRFDWPAGKAAAVFLVEFLLVSLTWIWVRDRTRLPRFRGDLLGAFGNAAFFFALLAASVHMAAYQGLVILCGCAIGMAAYHALVGGWGLQGSDDDLVIRYAYLGLALTFVTVAAPIQLGASYLTLAWAVESAVLVWMGTAARERRLRWYGMTLLAVTALRALFHDLPEFPEQFRFLINERMLSGASVVAACAASVWLLRKSQDTLSEMESYLPAVLAVVASVFALLFVSVDLWTEVGRVVAVAGRVYAQQLSLSILWSIYALGAMSVGIWRRHRAVRLFALALLYVSIGKVFLFDLSFLQQLYRIVSLFGLGVILLLVSLIYLRFEERLR